jgi:glutamate racemase
MSTRVLVFDSGVGGLSVVHAILEAGLQVDIDYLADNAWLPYGEKSDADLIARVPLLISRVADAFASDVVIVACNTASTIALDGVRAAMARPVVGVVPPIKPAAALSKTGVIGLLATPATIARAYTDQLVAQFASDRHVVRVGTTALVAIAEQRLLGVAPEPTRVGEAIAPLFAGPLGARIDVVALACTHFPLLVDVFKAVAPHPVTWLDSGAAIAQRLGAVSGAARGVARLRRAAFTRAQRDDAHWRGFEALGFRDHMRVTQRFDVAPMNAPSSFG